MKVFLTGGSGMVGRNFLEHPAASTLEIVSPDVEELDLFDFQAVKNYLGSVRPDMIIHAAGRVGGIQANIANPVAFLLENLDMGRNLVWAARRSGVHELIFLGSSCMYPRNVDTPLREDMLLTGELEPTNEGYAIAKIAVSRLCAYIATENPEFRYKTIIPCNLYGRWDKFDPVHSHMIPAVIRKIHLALQRGDGAIDVWGDGLARREFMYAGDLADCLHHAVREFDSLPEVMNAGLGHDHTINDYYAAVAKAVGYAGTFVHDTTKPVGMARKLLDVSRQSAWGWKPVTALDDGIKKTYEFFLQNAVST